jgi:hypothetical protein
MRFVILSLSIIIVLVSGCGPNVYRTQGLVLNPTYSARPADTGVPIVRRVLVIERKELVIAWQDRTAEQDALSGRVKPYHEYAAIPGQGTNGDTLLIDTRIFGKSRSELSDDFGKLEFWLYLPDGRKVKGKVVAAEGLLDHSKIMDENRVRKSCGTDATDKDFQDAQNRFLLFSRSGRILFNASGLVDANTEHLTFVVKDRKQEWRYRFDLTNDPLKAAGWALAQAAE